MTVIEFIKKLIVLYNNGTISIPNMEQFVIYDDNYCIITQEDQVNNDYIWFKSVADAPVSFLFTISDDPGESIDIDMDYLYNRDIGKTDHVQYQALLTYYEQFTRKFKIEQFLADDLS